MPRPKKATCQVTLRIPVDWFLYLEKMAREETAATGRQITRNDVIRNMLWFAIPPT